MTESIQEDLLVDLTPVEAPDTEAAVPNALYRFWDADGTLLYIGITLKPSSRWKHHAKNKPWWHEVAVITVEAFPNREAVEEAEREAIRIQRPKYNVVHNGGPGPFPAVHDMDSDTASIAADFFRAKANLKDPLGPLRPEQAQWVADMLALQAQTARAKEAQQPLMAWQPHEPSAGHIALSGNEIWICAHESDAWYFRLADQGVRLSSWEPGKPWAKNHANEVRSQHVVILVARFQEQWSLAADLVDAVRDKARSIKVVRPRYGPNAAAHLSTSRLVDLLPLPLPLRWVDDPLAPRFRELPDLRPGRSRLALEPEQVDG